MILDIKKDRTYHEKKQEKRIQIIQLKSQATTKADAPKPKQKLKQMCQTAYVHSEYKRYKREKCVKKNIKNTNAPIQIY